MEIALVTAAGVNIGAIDDSALLQAFHARGLQPEVVRWDDPSVHWRAFDAVWLRSCWDYHTRYDEFRPWLERAQRDGVRFVNSAALVLGNSHKGYLLALDEAGVPVPPLRLLRRGEAFDADAFTAFLASAGWTDVVLKPAVSASAYKTWRAHGAAPAEIAARAADMLTHGDIVIQRFVPEIATHGEWSLIFIDDVLSHAVRRVPPSGEFRSQMEFGATLTVGPPPASMVNVARAAIDAVSTDDDRPVIARIDLVERAGAASEASAAGAVVMEVELIEPVLYFKQVREAADRAIDAVLRRAETLAAATA